MKNLLCYFTGSYANYYDMIDEGIAPRLIGMGFFEKPEIKKRPKIYISGRFVTRNTIMLFSNR